MSVLNASDSTQSTRSTVLVKGSFPPRLVALRREQQLYACPYTVGQPIAIPDESAWIMLEAVRVARPNHWMYVRDKPYSSLILVWRLRVTLLCAPQKQPTG